MLPARSGVNLLVAIGHHTHKSQLIQSPFGSTNNATDSIINMEFNITSIKGITIHANNRTLTSSLKYCVAGRC